MGHWWPIPVTTYHESLGSASGKDGLGHKSIKKCLRRGTLGGISRFPEILKRGKGWRICSSATSNRRNRIGAFLDKHHRHWQAGINNCPSIRARSLANCRDLLWYFT